MPLWYGSTPTSRSGIEAKVMLEMRQAGQGSCQKKLKGHLMIFMMNASLFIIVVFG